MLSVFVLTIIFITGFSSPASAASKPVSYTQTLKYGQYYEPHKYDAARVMPGYAPMTVNTVFTVNQYGVTITDVSQKSTAYWPYSVSNNKTKVVTKTSRGGNEVATTYGDFTARYYILKTPAYTTGYRLQTNNQVLKIDKTKKTVTVKITKAVN
ncbi:hypothetical protein CN984_28895 [Bacillus cereus]|uniref:Surface layer protein A domain-containing protein n=1 Tax=Bacillus cereus TaxID=1396 RepID=A0A2B9PGX1_BACCE|nr:hypothetical protein [Bacillus cereus]PGO21321.1 hypothetical protein CN984_28895 [Bacillus cereus]